MQTFSFVFDAKFSTLARASFKVLTTIRVCGPSFGINPSDAMPAFCSSKAETLKRSSAQYG